MPMVSPVILGLTGRTYFAQVLERQLELFSIDWDTFLSHAHLILTCGYHTQAKKHIAPLHDIGGDILCLP